METYYIRDYYHKVYHSAVHRDLLVVTIKIITFVHYIMQGVVSGTHFSQQARTANNISIWSYAQANSGFIKCFLIYY